MLLVNIFAIWYIIIIVVGLLLYFVFIEGLLKISF